MSEARTIAIDHPNAKGHKSLWLVAAVIMAVVFAPAAIAWALLAVRG